MRRWCVLLTVAAAVGLTAGPADAARRCATPKQADVIRTTRTVEVYRRDFDVTDERDFSRTVLWACDRHTGRTTRFVDQDAAFTDDQDVDPLTIRGSSVGYGISYCNHYGQCGLWVAVWDVRARRTTTPPTELPGSDDFGPPRSQILQLRLSGRGEPVTLLDAPVYTPVAGTRNEIRDPRGALVAAGPSGSIQELDVDAGLITWRQDGVARSAPLRDAQRPPTA